jgi:hypothetical protein
VLAFRLQELNRKALHRNVADAGVLFRFTESLNIACPGSKKLPAKTGSSSHKPPENELFFIYTITIVIL